MHVGSRPMQRLCNSNASTMIDGKPLKLDLELWLIRLYFVFSYETLPFFFLTRLIFIQYHCIEM